MPDWYNYGVPRIAETRHPAQPTSPEQRERHRRILGAAKTLGADAGLDEVQMQDVARRAGVALGTLYRYFPSKVHLFSALLRQEVEQLEQAVNGPGEGQSGVEAVSRLLTALCRDMVDQPKLSLSLIQANNAVQAMAGADSAVIDHAFERLVLRASGTADPTPDERRRVRLVVQCWFGVLMSVLNGRSSARDADADIVRACELLLG